MNEEEEKRRKKQPWFDRAVLLQINPKRGLKRRKTVSVDRSRRPFDISSSQSHVGSLLSFVCRWSKVFSSRNLPFCSFSFKCKLSIIEKVNASSSQLSTVGTRSTDISPRVSI